MIKQVSSFFTVVLLLLLVQVNLSAYESFVIDHYQVDMDVIENNVYSVTEIIDTDFQEQRHGIIREIPLYFDDMPVRISDINVPGYEISIERNRKTLQIRIGSADSFVEGKVRYTISYLFDAGADSLDDMDEFNHNIIGTRWDTTIKAADFRITLPVSFNPADVNCTTGAYGSTDNTKVEWSVNDRTIRGRLLAPLNPYEGLTVALPLPEGYWVGAVRHREPGWLLYAVLGYPFYLMAVLLAGLLWFFKGRDNKLFPSVEFSPPEDLTPSEIGYIIDGQVDSKDITALILYWAHKGFLAIEEHEDEKGKAGTLELIKLGEPGKDARSYERHIFKKLFSYGREDRVTTDDLTNQFYKTVSWGQENVTKTFTVNPERAIFSKGSGGYTFLAGLMAFLPLFFFLVEMLAPLEGKGPLFLLGIPASLFVLIPWMIAAKGISGQTGIRKGVLLFAGLFGLISLGIIGTIAHFQSGISVYKCLAAGGSSFIISIFTVIMSRRTEYGDRILEKVLGFREFINKAEKEKLNMMFESDPQYFYNILPYAMVLGLSKKWSAHFNGMAVAPPSWYRGYRYDTFRTRDFERSLNRSFTSLNSSMNSSPSSGGSSGSSSSGGFSGGGSGGGGGSSW